MVKSVWEGSKVTDINGKDKRKIIVSVINVKGLNSSIERNRLFSLDLKQLGGILWKHLSKHKVTKVILFTISTNIRKDFIIYLIRNT